MNFENYNLDKDGIIRLQKDLNWQFKNLDSRHIKQIYTNQVEVKSENGLTELDGSRIIMKDDMNMTRLQMGLSNDNSSFAFSLYNRFSKFCSLFERLII